MELSDEMREAIRILKEDGQMASFNKLTESNREVIERLDHIENNYSEYRATQDEKNTAKQEESGSSSSTATDVPTNPGGPEPPPVKQEEPVVEKKARLAWWETGTYAGD
jgi:cell division protein FtsN